jgi:hypothetical protein
MTNVLQFKRNIGKFREKHVIFLYQLYSALRWTMGFSNVHCKL